MSRKPHLHGKDNIGLQCNMLCSTVLILTMCDILEFEVLKHAIFFVGVRDKI